MVQIQYRRVIDTGNSDHQLCGICTTLTIGDGVGEGIGRSGIFRQCIRCRLIRCVTVTAVRQQGQSAVGAGQTAAQRTSGAAAEFRTSPDRGHTQGAAIHIGVINQDSFQCRGRGDSCILQHAVAVIHCHRRIVGPGDGDHQLRSICTTQPIRHGVSKGVRCCHTLCQRIGCQLIRRITVTTVGMYDQRTVGTDQCVVQGPRDTTAAFRAGSYCGHRQAIAIRIGVIEQYPFHCGGRGDGRILQYAVAVIACYWRVIDVIHVHHHIRGTGAAGSIAVGDGVGETGWGRLATILGIGKAAIRVNVQNAVGHGHCRHTTNKRDWYAIDRRNGQRATVHVIVHASGSCTISVVGDQITTDRTAFIYGIAVINCHRTIVGPGDGDHQLRGVTATLTVGDGIGKGVRCCHTLCQCIGCWLICCVGITTIRIKDQGTVGADQAAAQATAGTAAEFRTSPDRGHGQRVAIRIRIVD
eukprot:RCo049842